MPSQFSKLLKSIFIYGFGNVSVKIIGLILLPLYTDRSLLSIEEYGAMGLLDVTAQILIALFSLSLYTSYARWYWDKKYEGIRKQMFFSCLSALALFAVILGLSGIAASRSLSNLLFESGEFAVALKMMIMAAGMQILIDFTLTQMRIEEKPLLYITTNIIRLIVILSFTLYFLLKKDSGLNGIYEAQIIGNIVFLVIALPYILKSIEFRFSYQALSEIMRFSLPLALAAVSNVLLVVLDRYVLNYKSTRLNVGIYTQGFKIANTTKIFIISSIQLALGPAIFKLMNREDNKEIYSRIMTWFTIIVVYFSLFLSLFGLEITKLFTTATVYWDAYKIIPLISLGITFGMLKDVSVTGLMIAKRTKIIGIMLTGIAVFNLIANLMLVPVLGIYGAALSSLVSQMIFFILVLVYAQKYYPIPYRLERVALIIFWGAILFIAGSLFNDRSLIIRIIIKSSALILFPVLLIASRVLDRSEIDYAVSFILNLKNIFISSKKEELEEKMTRIDEAEL